MSDNLTQAIYYKNPTNCPYCKRKLKIIKSSILDTNGKELIKSPAYLLCRVCKREFRLYESINEHNEIVYSLDRESMNRIIQKKIDKACKNKTHMESKNPFYK